MASGFIGLNRRFRRVVRVPSLAEKDGRQLHRELASLKQERPRHINRIKGLLINQGVQLELKADFDQRLAQAQLWDGSSLVPGLRGRVSREYARIELANQQIKALEAHHRELLGSTTDPQKVTSPFNKI